MCRWDRYDPVEESVESELLMIGVSVNEILTTE